MNCRFNVVIFNMNSTVEISLDILEF